MDKCKLQTDAIIQKVPAFRDVAIIMDNNLHEEDVNSAKFLCQGLVVASKLKRVDSAIELISLLESAQHVSETDFFLLADLLQYIQRIDVLQSIGYEEKEVIVRRRQQGSKVDPFYVLLFQIAEELPDEDVKKASYMYNKVPRAQTVNSGQDLFTIMVKHQAINADDVSRLKVIFQTIERQDMVELVDRYIATQGRSVMEDLEQNFARAMSFQDVNMQDALDRVTVQPPRIPQPQLQPQKGTTFLPGQGPSINDEDVRQPHRMFSIPFPESQSGHSQNYPSYMHPSPPGSEVPKSPSAPMPSLPLQQGFPSAPVVQSEQPPPPEEPPAPPGYDGYAIPWKILHILSTKIPATYWPELSQNLGVPVTSDWSASRMTNQHCLAVLKRWLDLRETQAMSAMNIKISLVKALHAADSQLMAEQIAHEMNINFQNVMRESVSSQVSNWNENDVASTGTAAPESMQVNHCNSFETAQLAPMSRQMEPQSLYRSPIPYYRMNRKPRGVCIIINNRDFYKDPQRVEAKTMISREGTDVDRNKLKETFKQLNFLVDSRDNLTDVGMIQLINTAASWDHSQFDCFVCCILTHGVQGALYGVNGITVPIRDLTAPFRSQACPSLNDKPKLFFMQACQGRDKQEGRASDMQMDSAVETDSPPELIPNEADFLLGYATVPGFVSYRSKTKGSWYITKLTELLDKHAYNHDLHDILTLVNYEVGKGDAMIEGGQYKQSPAPMYSLRKKLIFQH